MKTLHHRLIVLGLLMGVATVAGAYTPPSGAAFELNTSGPITIGVTNQDKAGGLWVKTFQARGDAYFNLDTYIQGDIIGKDLRGDGTTTVRIGGQTADGVIHTVSAGIHGAISVNGVIQSNSLATGPGGGKKPVCADANGTFFLCSSTTPPPTPTNTPPATSATVAFYVNGGDQTGTFVMIQSDSSGTAYMLEMSPGQNMGASNSQVVQTGTYTLVQSDIQCTMSGTSPFTPTVGDQFFLSDGDFYTINFSC